MIIYAICKSLFQDDGVPEGLLLGRNMSEWAVCVLVFTALSFLYAWFLLFPSTRWSSDSVAPGDSFPIRSQEMKGFVQNVHSPSMQGISQVIEPSHC